MKILLFTAYFPPDTGSAAHLFYEFGTELVSRGYKVSVITSLPGYHTQGNLNQYKRKLWLREKVAGIDVIRVPSLRLPPQFMLGRALWQFSLAATILLAGLFVSKHDLAVVYSPPLTIGLSAWVLRMIKRIPFVFNVQDLFPQSIIDLGLLSNPMAIRFFENIEQLIYRQANAITVFSNGNLEHVVKNGAQREKVHVIRNWVDTNFILPGVRENEFRREHDLGDNFIISFAGIMGFSQDLDLLLDCAQIIKGREDIKWVIVGDGVEKSRLITKAQKLNLDNVIFLPMQSRNIYPSILHASDICLVPLHKNVKTPTVPSKIMSIMAAGRPIIAAMNLEGDAPKIISDAECGRLVSPGNPNLLAEAIIELYGNPLLRESMGREGRSYAIKHLSLKISVDKYVQLFLLELGIS